MLTELGSIYEEKGTRKFEIFRAAFEELCNKLKGL